MARLEKIIEIKGGRDDGKLFKVTELPPMRSYKWVLRAIKMLASSGIELPHGTESLGIAGLAGIDFKELASNIDWNELEPLLDELMVCVTRIPNPDDQTIARPVIASDIEDALTFAKLQQEAFFIHVNFYPPASV